MQNKDELNEVANKVGMLRGGISEQCEEMQRLRDGISMEANRQLQESQPQSVGSAIGSW
jgi:hypothetical protein